MLGEQGGNFYDNGFGIRSGQHLQRADFAHGITDHTDKDGNEQGDYDPDGCNAAGQFQFFFILDCHKAEQDMRHTEISKSPCGSGNNGQGTVRSGLSGVYIIGKCHGEISRKLGGVVDNGTDTASSFYTKDQNYNQSNRHDDTLDKVRCGSSKGSGAASGNISSATGSLHGSDNQAGSSYDYDSSYDSDDGSLRDFEAGLEEGFKDGLKAGNRGMMGGMVAAAIAIGILIVVFLVIFVLILLVDVFIINPLEVGCRRFFIRNLNEPAQIGNIGYGFDNNYRNVAKTMFFRDLFTVLWSLLFIIPGIVKAYEYMMIPYLLADNPQMTKEQAFAESKRMMQGQKWKAFVLDLSFIGWYILSGLTLGILAIFYVSPYVNATHAALYEALCYANPAGSNGFTQQEDSVNSPFRQENV